MPEQKMTTRKLSLIRDGQSATISYFDMPESDSDRLSAMGLFVGQHVLKKHSQPMKGPVSLQLNGSNIAISSRLASHIMVEIDE